MSEDYEALEREISALRDQVEKLKGRLKKVEEAYRQQQNYLIDQELAKHPVLPQAVSQRERTSSESTAGRSQPQLRPWRAPSIEQTAGSAPARQASGKAWTGKTASATSSFGSYGAESSRWPAPPSSREPEAPARSWQPVSSAPRQRGIEETEQAKVERFKSGYNALLGGRGIAGRDARKRFLQEFSVLGISCTNYEERMSNPDALPRYAELDAMRADYWAMQVKGELYAVVPNAKLTYDSAHHAAGAMKVAFASNFASGHTYGRIQVERPALFSRLNGGWSVAKQGRLNLSE